MDIKATCEWFFELGELKSWENGEITTPAVTGTRGIGKSTLCEVGQFYREIWLELDPNSCTVLVPLTVREFQHPSRAAVLSFIYFQDASCYKRLFGRYDF